MSIGKYSPVIKRYTAIDKFGYDSEYDHNARGEKVDFKAERVSDETYYSGFDRDGYDKYGYGAYDREGNYVGGGDGVDRAGFTEDEYLRMVEYDIDGEIIECKWGEISISQEEYLDPKFDGIPAWKRRF